ncbi:MAG: hypothetical protein Q4C75_03515 [Bergeyella zoohelcum]|nr:hypothetical protein [Bergeyella zoohelcum]
MKNVNFAPFVGENYEKGINGKKVLILGESHYWEEEIYEDAYEDLKQGEYLDFTQDVIKSYIDYQKGNREHSPWMNSFTKFAKEFYNWDEEKTNLIDFWQSVAFYNYVQFPISQARTSPTEEEFTQSEKAFYEVVEKYQPDVIIAWGWRLWGNMPSTGRFGEPSSVNKGKGIYYYEVAGREYPIIAVSHPSAPGFCYSAFESIEQIMNAI